MQLKDNKQIDGENRLYRYVDCYNDNRPYRLVEYKILWFTKKGCWIEHHDIYDNKVWVSNDARKKFAYQTIQEAMYNYMRRKKKHLKLLKSKLSDIEWAFDMINKELKQEEDKQMNNNIIVNSSLLPNSNGVFISKPNTSYINTY